MLASADQHQELGPLGIPGLDVILPEELKAFFYETGYLPTTAEEFRSNARLRVRSVGELVIAYTPIALRPGTLERSAPAGKVLIKDLSRSGIGILYHHQIFPEEQFKVRFQNRLIHAVAVRCRRVGPKCYETGGRIIAMESSSPS